MEENKSCFQISIKLPKRSPPLTDSDEGCKTPHNEAKPSSNGDADEIAKSEYPKSRTRTCPECGKTFPSDKSLFGHLRCHPERSYRGVHPPPLATNKRCYPEAHDSAAKPLPLVLKWPTRKRSRRLPRDIEENPEEATAARTRRRSFKAQSVVIVNEEKTLEGERIVKKKSPPLTDSDEGCRIAHNEAKPSSNGDADEIDKIENPNSRTSTCPECGKIFPAIKSLFGHLRCHPERSYRGVHPPPLATKKRRYPEAHDSAAKPLPFVLKWPTRKRSRRLPRDIEEDSEETTAARTLMKISKTQPVIVNRLKTPEGERIVKKKIIEESEQENTEPGACGRWYKCSVCMKSFSSHHALGGHKASHRENKNTNPKEEEKVNVDLTSQAASISNSLKACGSEYQKEKTHDPSPSAHSSDQTVPRKASYRVFDFDLNETPKPEEEEES